MPNADIGANGALFIAPETTYGTAIDPSVDDSDGVWVPILNESLKYTTEPYYSEQIRQEAVHSDAVNSYYHVEGDIEMEVDANYLPFFMLASRHTVVQTGMSPPYLYTATPTGAGATYPGGSLPGATITALRNAVGFMFSGCIVNTFAFTLDNGIGKLTASILGLAESEVDDDSELDPAWVAPNIFGADAHSVYVDASGTSPAFASPSSIFNGYTYTITHNAEPQNRIKRDRAATYVKYGITELDADTELDFVDRTEYDNYKNLTFKAYRFEAVHGTDWASATDGYRITTYRANYNTYDVGLDGMGDLVMAKTTLKGLGINGGSAYKIECKSSVDLGLS